MQWHKIIGAGGVGGAAPDPAWLYSNSTTGTTTFSSVGLGTAHSSRFIIVGVQFDINAATTVSSVTVAGVSATKVTSSVSGAWYGIEMWGASVPTGSTGDIVVTTSASHQYAMHVIGTYVSSTTPTATVYKGDQDPSDVSLNTSGSNALVVTFGGSYNPTKTFTSLTGATIVGNTPQTTYVSWSFRAGLAYGLSAETPRTVSWDWNAGGFGLRVIAASFEGA